ncbi:MAG: sigma 54-interacting transcriptional regulator [Planctomycetes bacterium]|nr:sigma 54-interacting transcriptional regulator [Planctomycetota bacterium]
MQNALHQITAYLNHFLKAIASIVGVDVEIIDPDRNRVAGTGIYAERIGESIAASGELIYAYALSRRETVFIDNPRRHRLCRKCKYIKTCQETLTFCTPIVCSGQVLGIIGLVCFTEQDKERVLTNKDVYLYFFRQIADGIARVAESQQGTQRLRQTMDMLLKVTNSDMMCVLVLDVNNRISFLNDAARRELGLSGDHTFDTAEIIDTGDRYPNIGEYEIRVASDAAKRKIRRHIVLGRLLPLPPDDLLYNKALVFDSKHRMAEIVSNSGTGPETGNGLTRIVGRSAGILNLKEQVLKIASTSSTVLITGESGTGKEMFARAIHAASSRSDKPFIALNCGAIPDSLLESELFGYVGGAFTGASPSGRMGKFELADTGVLFLDEISSMPLYLQVKLLRVLQERNFSRLGSNTTVSVDIRVIAATNDNIPELIEQRMFREDLYYRLNVIPMHIPPLRSRKEDIGPLADYFLEKYCSRFGKKKMRLSDCLMKQLLAYPWPGNIREFENCMEYMANMHSGGVLDADALPVKITHSVGVDSPVASPAAPARRDEETEIVPLRQLEMNAIRQALGKFENSSEGKRLAALALGISTATLYRKLKVLDVAGTDEREG